MSKNVKLIRLRHTPEEFLAEIESIGSDKITFTNPMLIVANGNGVGLRPWSMISLDRTFMLSMNDVMFVVESMPSLVEGYIEATSGLVISANASRIAVPNK